MIMMQMLITCEYIMFTFLFSYFFYFNLILFFHNKEIKTSPLLTAIQNKKTHITKYLIFRKSDMYSIGEFGDALVTSVHFDAPPELITLLLEKGANLSSRHNDWVIIILLSREFSIFYFSLFAYYSHL